jgi:undecaprenyl-diphosphatase
MREHQIFKKFTSFVEARLSPGGEFGLHLTAGMAILVVAGYIFHELAEAVMGQEAITVLDLRVAHWFNARAVEPYTSLMLAVSAWHSVAGMSVMVLALGIYFWRAKARYWLLALVFSVPGGMVLNVTLKYIFQRSRPVFEEPLVTLTTYSFPSGHTTAATCFYGLLASYLVIARPGWNVRLGTVAATCWRRWPKASPGWRSASRRSRRCAGGARAGRYKSHQGEYAGQDRRHRQRQRRPRVLRWLGRLAGGKIPQPWRRGGCHAGQERRRDDRARRASADGRRARGRGGWRRRHHQRGGVGADRRHDAAGRAAAGHAEPLRQGLEDSAGTG